MAAASSSPPSANKQTAVRGRSAADQKTTANSQNAWNAAQTPEANLLASPLELVVSTPKSGVLWRFKDSNKIERTQDGGKTWVLQKNPTQENILAASAASDTVCWAGGSNGMLLRTTDGGETWVRMASPTKYAIVSLSATDNGVVTLVSADGHKFETRDAGAHWRPL
jgi:photosystem II stability/assembly factor-like uncharacterized protein